MNYQTIKNYSNGKWIESNGTTRDIISPVNGECIGTVVNSTKDDLNQIVEEASIAQKAWGAQTLKKRSEVLYNYRVLLQKHRDELATASHLENGKHMEDAYAEVDKAIELTEFACSIPQIAAGEIEEVSNGVVCQTERRALGVVASIVPFNFPIMVPHWTIPNAIALGNAMIIKPSSSTPISTALLVNLWEEAGLPNGIFNIYNGGKDAVEAICDHKGIKAVSFVGSSSVAETVYKRSAQSLKRALALGGAKNYLIVTPDAHVDGSARDIVASSTGMSGQRCMAASVLVLVDDCSEILNSVIAAFKKQIETKELAPLINEKAVQTIKDYINYAKEKGAQILVDGTTLVSDNACMIGPTLIDWKGVEHEMKNEEVFGPVLEILHTDSIQGALELEKNSQYGNACSIFTGKGRYAAEVTKVAEAGMLGVNIGVPVPREPFSFGGIKASKYGFGDITGKLSIDFWTDLIKITTKWNPEDKKDWMS